MTSMKILIAQTFLQKSLRRTKLSSLLVCLTIFVFAIATANAQTVSKIDAYNQTTAPNSGLVLKGSGINPVTGKNYAFLWGADSNGLCRFDPDVNENTPPPPGGPNINSCTSTLVGLAFVAYQMTYDSVTNNVYLSDIRATSGGVFRFHFNPDGDNGRGAIDVNGQALLAATKAGNKIPPGTCFLPGGTLPSSAAMGPDGALYVAFLRGGGAIVKLSHPEQEPFDCANIETVASTPDGKKNFGLAWIGHDLYGGDGTSAWVIPNADILCSAAAQCTGGNILAAQTNAPVAMTSDQVYPSLNGQFLYFTDGFNVTRVQANGLVATQFFSTGFQNALGLAVNADDPSNEQLFVGDDAFGEVAVNQGNWWLVANVATAAPAAPINVSAIPGPASATVSWTRGDSQPTSSYTVHTFLADGVTPGAPDVTVPPSQTSVTISGLSSSQQYEFNVTAQNAIGTSPASAFSNLVMPFAATVPDAPTGVIAVAGDASATVAWSAPLSNGGPAITNYNVTAHSSGGTNTFTVAGTVTQTLVTGLTNNAPYFFTVSATNSVGTGVDSAPSNTVTPQAVKPDTSLVMTGPASVSTGSNATYTLTVKNVGTVAAPGITLIDNIPVGSTFVAFTAPPGITCLNSATQVLCSMGNLAAGAPAVSVSIILRLTTSITNTATAQATGEVNLGDNSASTATTVAPPPPPPVTTDLQITGSAANGGPRVPAADSYTFQMKNNGNSAANNVVFTDNLPPSLIFQGASDSTGTCIGPPIGSAGGTITCTSATLAKGTNMIVTVNVSVPAAGTISNTGSVAFNGTDTNTNNNSVTVTINAR